MELYFPGEGRLEYAWVTPRLAVGPAIFTPENMMRLAAKGVTHVLNLETEFDDSKITGTTGIVAHWLPQPDDLRPKPPQWFEQGVGFVEEALSRDGSRVYIHCLAGIQRGPMMMLAYLCTTGMEMNDAIHLVASARPEANFPLVYLRSIQLFLRERKSPG